MIYTVTMNPALDYVVRPAGGLRPGQVNRTESESIQFGGKGVNVSNVLRALGMETVALGFVAGFTGRALREGLEAMGLETRFLELETGMTRINVKLRGEEETELNGMGPCVGEAELQRLRRQLEQLVPGDALVLSGSLPRGLAPDTYGRILNWLEGRQVLTAVDAAGALLTRALPGRPFLIKPNRAELEAIFGRSLSSEAQLPESARALQEMGARNVLVSLAGDGALLLDETGVCRRVRCPRGEVINSVGAGDSMVAGFLAGYLRTGDYGEALRLGAAAGSATAFSLGLADPAQIRALASQITLELL